MIKLPFTFGANRRRVALVSIICAIGLVAVAWKTLPLGAGNSPAPSPDERPYGALSGAELREALQAEGRRKAARYSDADLQLITEGLFVQDDPHRANFDGLLYSGMRALPFLLKALDDPRTSTMVFTGHDIYGLGASPFERICNLLWNLRPAEAAAPLTKFLDHPNPVFRRTAAWLLASIGTNECLDPVKKALADKDREVPRYVLIGLTSMPKRRQRDEQFVSGVFPALIPMLNAGTYDVESPASAMMAMNSAKAVPILESPRYFSVHNPQLSEVLEALNRPKVKVPGAILLPLLEKLKPASTKESPGDVTYAAALTLYANNPDDDAENRFRILINSPSSIISSSAARGLETLAGINVHDVLWDVYDHSGFTTMTQPQRFCFAVELYMDEVNNGGHEQYFYNDDSDLYEVASEGLHAIGATPQAEILSDASRAFAPGRPALTEQQRRLQMKEFGPYQDHIFRAADERFYQLQNEPDKRLDTLMTLYALKHRSDFTVASLSDVQQATPSIGAKNP